MKSWSRIALVCWFCCHAASAHAQNWLLTIRDVGQGTPVYQVNGMAGRMGTLYGSIDNLTGTLGSDDGTGNRAPATQLDFAGIGFIQNPGQMDLGSLYVPDARIPGYPQVGGSQDGRSPGTSSFLSLGAFDLSHIGPGIYQEDFIASAYPDDFNSTLVFGDITGTLTLSVSPPSPTPEPSGALMLFSATTFLLMVRSIRHGRRFMRECQRCLKCT